jgi:hypothetical protein
LLENFLGPAILAICTGLAYVAYKHRETFDHIGMILTVGFLALILVFFGYIIGIWIAWWAVKDTVPANLLPQVQQAIEGWSLSTPVVLITSGFAVYLSVLAYVTRSIHREEDKKKNEREKRDANKVP